MDFHSLLVCPLCADSLNKISEDEFKCSKCSKQFRIKDDIPVLIENDTYYNNQ